MRKLYIILGRSKLEYASVVFNGITSIDDSKLERFQQRFAFVCFNHFFPQVHYCYSLALEDLKLHILHTRRHRLDELFLIQVFLGSKFWPSVLEIVGHRVPSRYIRDFALSSVFFSCKNCSSAKCVSTARIVCRGVGPFRAKNVLLNHIVKYIIIVITIIILTYMYMYV
jgi:hypothetical protein